MADVFISYAHADRDLARTIAEQLIEAGAEVWWDRELIAGDDFDEAILERAKAANCIVVIWTQGLHN
jgi:TIR domain